MDFFALYSLPIGSRKLLWVCNHLLISASSRWCCLPVVRLRSTSGCWPIVAILKCQRGPLAYPPLPWSFWPWLWDLPLPLPIPPPHMWRDIAGFRQTRVLISGLLLFILAARVKLNTVVQLCATPGDSKGCTGVIRHNSKYAAAPTA